MKDFRVTVHSYWLIFLYYPYLPKYDEMPSSLKFTGFCTICEIISSNLNICFQSLGPKIGIYALIRG